MNHMRARRRANPVGVALVVLTVIAVALTILGVTATRADATTGKVEGVAYCADGDTWGVVWTFTAYDVPGSVESDVKAMTTSAGTLAAAPGAGVMAGAQVMLNAWSTHAINWPGVPTRKGGWTEQFSTVGVPGSVGSVTTMTQYDYSNGHSGDPVGEVPKPENCEPPEETPEPTPTPTATPSPTCTPDPADDLCSTPMPTATPTPTPDPSPTCEIAPAADVCATPTPPVTPPTTTPTPPESTNPTTTPPTTTPPPSIGPPPSITRVLHRYTCHHKWSVTQEMRDGKWVTVETTPKEPINGTCVPATEERPPLFDETGV